MPGIAGEGVMPQPGVRLADGRANFLPGRPVFPARAAPYTANFQKNSQKISRFFPAGLKQNAGFDP
jgi:hypothetical protein